MAFSVDFINHKIITGDSAITKDVDLSSGNIYVIFTTDGVSYKYGMLSKPSAGEATKIKDFLSTLKTSLEGSGWIATAPSWEFFSTNNHRDLWVQEKDSEGVVTQIRLSRVTSSDPATSLVESERVAAQSFSVSSDIRLKQDIAPLPACLEKVMRLRPVSFTMDGVDNSVGLIAQEVREVFPELVDEDSEGYLSVNYTELLPIIAKSIQEFKELKNGAN